MDAQTHTPTHTHTHTRTDTAQLNNRSHVDDMLRDLKWMSVKQRHDYHTAVMMFKCINGLAPAYLADMFKCSNTNVHRYPTRVQNVSVESGQLYLPKVSLECGKRMFNYRGVLLWNDIDQNVRVNDSVSTFKANYMTTVF